MQIIVHVLTPLLLLTALLLQLQNILLPVFLLGLPKALVGVLVQEGALVLGSLPGKGHSKSKQNKNVS